MSKFNFIKSETLLESIISEVSYKIRTKISCYTKNSLVFAIKPMYITFNTFRPTKKVFKRFNKKKASS